MKVPRVPNPDDRLLWELRLGVFNYPAVTVADELGVFNSLSDGTKTIKDLAERTNISERAAEILTNVLWGLNLVDKKKNKITLSKTAKQYLTPASPFYWGNVLKLSHQGEDHRKMLDAFRKDGSAIQFGGKNFTDMWEQGSVDEAAAANFTARMHDYIFSPALGAARTQIFRGVKNLLDVGGGSGAFCIALAAANKKISPTVFDLPAVCKVAQTYIEKYQLTDRIKTVSGNFCREELPTGFDGILFSNIFHDWGIDRCQELANKAYEALPKGGKIFIHEMVHDPAKKGPLAVSCFSMLMFLNHPSAQQYSEKQLFDFLKNAGFKKMKRQKTFSYYSIVTGVK